MKGRGSEFFKCRLALATGSLRPTRILRGMSSRDYSWWRAYFNEPRGEDRIDWHFARLEARIGNILRTKDFLSAKELLLEFEEADAAKESPRSEQSVEEMKEQVEMLGRAFGWNPEK